jgi:2',3'-cyclic-nucleotide 2'-phosphodiesterase/3'-nucleotidase
MKRRLIALLLAVVLVAALLPAAYAAEASFPFTDVPSGSWSRAGVAYAWENGLMKGTGGTTFSPKTLLTRGMFITTLYRMAGSPAVTDKTSFPDVAADSYYADAAAWGKAQKIVSGSSDGLFHPEDVIQRQQFAVMLCNYAKLKGWDTASTTGMTYYDDAGSVAEYAAPAVCWTLAKGYLNGTSASTLSPTAGTTREQAAVILARVLQSAAAKTDVSVQVLATSDMHGWFEPWDFSTDTASTRGSLTYLATLIRQHQKQNANTVLVDCGDATQSNYVEYFIGRDSNPMITAMNDLGYDVWTFGNHEYNFGYADRHKLIDEFDGAVLSGNVFKKGTSEPYLPATTVVERGGVKIGFVGMTTPLIVSFEKGKTSLQEVDVKNPMDVIGGAIASLKAQKVDCIVGLIHEGLDEENDVKGTATTEIAKAFPDFDVIISGHAHKSVTSETVNGVLLCEPYYYGRSLSVVDLGFVRNADGSYALSTKNASLQGCGSVEDAELVKLMEPFKTELREYVNTPIGELKNADLSAPDKIKGISAANTGATGILNLLSTSGIYYSGADCTLLNTDFEHPGFPVGSISIKNIASSYSFTGGEISVYPVTGKQLKTILEWSADYFNQMKPGDLTISYNPVRRESKYSSNFVGGGICYEIDLTQPTGSRIRNLALIEKDKDGNPVYTSDGKLKTTPITDASTIKLGTNSYYMDQWTAKDGCLEGQTLKSVYSSSDEYGDDGTVRNLTIKYIVEHLKGVVDGKLYNYANWSIRTGVDETSELYKKAVELIGNGTITLPASETGRTNIASVTEEMVKSH